MGIVRLNPDGTLDPTFGGGGRRLLGFDLFAAPSQDEANAVAVQGTGEIVIAGTVDNALGVDFAVARLNPDGSIDGTFNAGGFSPGRRVISFNLGGGDADHCRDLAIQPGGRIVLAGDAERGGGNVDYGLARLNPDGTLDTTFDGDGRQVVPFDLGSGNVDRARALALQPDGRIVVVGAVTTAAPGDSDFGVARLNPDGTLDTTFSGDGRQTVAFNLGGSNVDRATDVAVQDGRIVVVGSAERNAAGDNDFAVVRLREDGTLDGSFAPTAGGPSPSTSAAATPTRPSPWRPSTAPGSCWRAPRPPTRPRVAPSSRWPVSPSRRPPRAITTATARPTWPSTTTTPPPATPSSTSGSPTTARRWTSPARSPASAPTSSPSPATSTATAGPTSPSSTRWPPSAAAPPPTPPSGSSSCRRRATSAARSPSARAGRPRPPRPGRLRRRRHHRHRHLPRQLRPRPGAAQWFILPSGPNPGGFATTDGAFPVVFGAPGGTDLPAPADYDGDGHADIATFRPVSDLHPGAADWFILPSAPNVPNYATTTGGMNVTFGAAGNADQPAVADYNGDGRADITAFRSESDLVPGSAQWFVLPSAGAWPGFGGGFPVTFGAAGAIAAVGDYNRDGRPDLALFDATAGTWALRDGTGGAALPPVCFGPTGPGVVPVLAPLFFRLSATGNLTVAAAAAAASTGRPGQRDDVHDLILDDLGLLAR